MRKLFLLLILSTISFSLFAQKTISGKITDSKTGEPLPGVTVRLKSAKTGTLTNNEGVFTLKVNPNDVIEITSIGFNSQSIKITDQSQVDITLQPSYTTFEEVIMVGSRGVGRVKTESPVPVDVIHVNDAALTTAKPDLMSQLNMSVPSFNYNKQSGGDGSDAIDFASLRGLGFDQTLVLINGKRRHLSAFVNQVGTRGRGNSGTDLNAIPEASIDRIEILRDGASAQYGSDAIAGVINIILKKDVKHLNVNLGASAYYDHKYNSLNSVDPSQFYTGSQIDGKTVTVGLSYGLPVGKNGGFINLSGNFLASGKTFRAEPDTAVSKNGKALPVNVWRRAFGDGAVTSGGGMVNSEIPIAGTKTTFYFFGGYNYKLSNVYAWTRNFSNSNHIRKYPTDANGSLIFVPDIMRKTTAGNVYYNPQENVHISDASFAIGFKGSMGNGWDWDISNVIGRNDFHYFGYKTFNASLLPVARQASKTDFDDGGFSFLQNTANLDITKHFSNVGKGLTISAGAEFRYEHYKLYKGELESYNQGGAYYISGGDTVYKASGSEGYPGYTPSDEANAHRTNVGGYIDLALDVTEKWLIDAAARFENYSDFGFVNTYKFATRYKLSSNFNLRGSISTGFRAPSLQQINFSNTNTNIIAGQLVYAKLSPNYGPITKAAQIPQLKQEVSVNGSLGFSWKPAKNLTFTIDGYWVKLKNRIVGTGYFDASIPVLAPFLAQYSVGSVNFFANAVSTTNTGVDIVIDYTKRWGKRRFSALVAGNIQNINIDKINIPGPLNDTYAHRQAFFSTREESFLKASAPRAKFSLALEYAINKIALGTHLTYFGKLTTQGFGYSSLTGAAAGGPGGAGISDQGNGWDPYVTTDDGKSVIPENFVFHGKVTTDVYLSFKFTKGIVWNVGVDNIFNVHPDEAVIANARNASWGDSESGGPFDPVQMGFNGLRMFTKLSFNF
ncbi:MAG: iron complex outerrane recepter protein [Segetibacter sp.]|nr:iron complex outerrane recepter protein [Segetibacter sp.]